MNVLRYLSVLIVASLGLAVVAVLAPAASAVSDTQDLDFDVIVSATVQLSQTNCNSSTDPSTNLLSLSTSLSSPFASNCQDLAVSANTPGYKLQVRAENQNNLYNSGNVTNNLLYDDPSPNPYPTPFPIIAATTNLLSAPNVLAANTWGFAVTSSNLNLPSTNQDSNAFQNYSDYQIDERTNKYANLPVTDTTVYHSDTLPTQTDNFRFFYGVLVDALTVPGTYSTTITYTLTGEFIPCQWDNSDPPMSFDDPACVEPTPLPGGVEPTNTALTIDIYPTTGWEEDSIALMSDNQFTNVTGVTIDSTACLEYSVYNPSLISCKLPTKPAGTKAAIAVTTSSTTFDMNGLKVQYFDPNRTELIGTSQSDHTTFDTFTTADCAAMTRTAGQNDGQIVYLTDTRNNQTYPVRKMADNKCWMIDNMKYLGEGLTITNVDSTSGIFLRNGTHTGTGGGTYNTVDGTDTQSTANSDKAFYNTPMTSSYCYGTGVAYSARSATTTGCGYLYNWYAATAGTGTYSLSTIGATASASICPTGTHLPTAYNGSAYTEFAVLNASMNAGNPTAASTSTSYYAGWQPSGSFSGVFSGIWYNALYEISSISYLWSSSAGSSDYARDTLFNLSYVNPGNDDAYKSNGFAVRCVVGV